MKKLSLIFLSAVLCGLTYAEVKMPSIFGDNMLLQRDMSVKIWGKADANAKVDVSFAGQKKSTKADVNGNWSLKLDKMSANKNPQEMTISENGKIGKTIKNILVGEVWIAGGQSNMQWNIYSTTEYKNFAERAKYPTIRYFNQNTCTLAKEPAFDSPKYSSWLSIENPKNFAGCSAVGLYFAEKLMKDLDVPVGIVFTALGASKMICWLPEEKITSLPYLQKGWKNFQDGMAKYDYKKAYAKWEKDVVAWEEQVKQAKAQNKAFNVKKPFEPDPLSCLNLKNQTPVYLYNGVVAPIAGYGARGVIWYQGESDSYGETLTNFQSQFGLILDAWREKFENPKLHFIHSQLASFGKGHAWPMTRWQQYLCSKNFKRVSVVCIADLGEKDDVHPRDKDIVGDRFAKLALEKVYGKKVGGLAPEVEKVSYKNDTAVVQFNTYGYALIGKGEPRGFEVRVNGKWCKAKAMLSGNSVIVKSLTGENVEAVRYLWCVWSKPEAWLFSKNGLPAFSFTHPLNLTSIL